MADGNTAGRINEFLGSANVFASAVRDFIEARILREVAGDQITLSQLKLLKLVSLTDKHTIGDAANFLGISKAAASKAVDKLARKMLLRRSEGEADRRSILLSLTEPSRRLLAAYESARQRKLSEIFGQFPLEELHQAAELLDRLSAHIVDRSLGSEVYCLQCGLHFREKCLIRQKLNRKCLYQQQKERGETPAFAEPAIQESVRGRASG